MKVVVRWNIINFFKTVNVSFFPVTNVLMQNRIIVCSVIAHCTHWAINAEEIIPIQSRELRIAQTV